MSTEKYAKSEDLPIEVVGRRLICENTKFFVYFDHVIDKAGSEVQNYLVVAPKNSGINLITGVAILPIINGQVGLIRIYRAAIRTYVWEIPHGFVEEGESDNFSALRELLEETGLTVELSSFLSLGYIAPDGGILASRVHIYLAEVSCLVPQPRQHEMGLREFRLFSFQELEGMIERSEIQDTFTLAAWCKYQLLLNARRTTNTSAKK